MDRMYFIGVTTSGSSIMDLFPLWAATLGLDAELVGLDIPLGADPAIIRGAIKRIIDDPDARGGLVTTHKVAIGEHASDLFASLDSWALLCDEVSCIVKRDGELHGSAKDPDTSCKSFLDIVGTDHFIRHPDAEVLCLGAGGSGTAFTARLLTAPDPPARIHVTNRSTERLRFLEEVHRQVGHGADVLYHHVEDAVDNDRVMAGLPRHSVVVNATGMGKDRPGSPVSGNVLFPEEGVVWEFNYRGTLEFLHQARSQVDERHLQVEDGWRYFLYGWSEHIADVFGFELDDDIFEKLIGIAEEVRSGRT